MLLDYDGWDDWEMYNEYEVPSYEELKKTIIIMPTLQTNPYLRLHYCWLTVTRTSKNQLTNGGKH
jgi:hypothetical protein